MLGALTKLLAEAGKGWMKGAGGIATGARGAARGAARGSGMGGTLRGADAGARSGFRAGMRGPKPGTSIVPYNPNAIMLREGGGAGGLQALLGKTPMKNVAIGGLSAWALADMLGIGEGEGGPSEEELQKALLMLQLQGQLGGFGGEDPMAGMSQEVMFEGANDDIDFAQSMASDDFLDDLVTENAGLLSQIAQMRRGMGMPVQPGMGPPGMGGGMGGGMPPMPGMM